MNLFDPNNYNFTDSIITRVEFDADTNDLLILIDYFQGKDDSIKLTLKLEGIKEFTFSKNSIELTNDKWTSFSIANISKVVLGEYIQIIIYPIISFMPEHDNDTPILNCICEKVFVE